MKNVEELKEELNNRYKVVDLEWYSWPQSFGTTAGPKGCGGNTITTFQVYAFIIYTENECYHLKYCGKLS